MRLNRHIHPAHEIESHFEQSRITGILNWQELAHLDFEKFIEVTRARNVPSQKSEGS